MKQTTITIKHIIQKDLATTNTFKYNIYRHTTKTYYTHVKNIIKEVNEKTIKHLTPVYHVKNINERSQ